MEEITEQEAQIMIEEGKEEIKQIINEGGKVTDTIIYEKDKITSIRKIEPVNGEATSSTTIQTKGAITISCS